MNNDIKDICSILWEVEKKYDLMELRINGVNVWPNIRMNLYYDITRKCGIFEEAHRNKVKYNKLKRVFYIIKNSIMNNPFKGDYNKELLIFDHRRKVLIQDNYIDIYTDNIIKEMEEESVDIIEKDYNGIHHLKSEGNRRYEDSLYLYCIWDKIFRNVKLLKKDIDLLYSIEKEFRVKLNIEIDLIKMVKNFLVTYNSKVEYYDRLIKKRRPKAIIVLVGYYRTHLILAAKLNRVKVIELQHGVISKYHLGYSYPDYNKKIECFPDYLLTFGEYWKNVATMPIEKKYIIPYGFPYFNKSMEKFENTEVVENQVIFISQGVIGRELSKICLEYAKNNPDKKIIYKLHPGEYADWKEKYDELVLAQQGYGVEVITSSNKNLYEYFAESPYVVGVFSTAIYEALAFGCKTILVNLPGIEYMSDLIENNVAKLINNANELCEVIQNNSFSKFETEYFFCKTGDIRNIVNDIIEEEKMNSYEKGGENNRKYS